MNTIEAKNIEVETVTILRNSMGRIEMRTDAHGRHLYCVRGEVFTGYGITRPASIFVWAMSARDARGEGSLLYEAKNGCTLYVNHVSMPIH